MADLRLAVRLDAIPIQIQRIGGLQKALHAAARLGAEAVEIDARNSVRPSELSDTGLRQLRKMLSDLNLRVAAIRFQTRRGYDCPDDLERRVDATKQAMSFAYDLNAPVVVNQIGSVDDTDEAGNPTPRMQAAKAVLDDLGAYGAKVGAFLAAETGTESGETLAKFLELSENAYVAVAFNPGQLIINRHNVRDAIRALGDRIQVVCAVDGVLDLAAGRGLHVPLGQGTADFPELLGELENIPYRGPLIVGRAGMDPTTSMNELQDGLTYLRSL